MEAPGHLPRLSTGKKLWFGKLNLQIAARWLIMVSGEHKGLCLMIRLSKITDVPKKKKMLQILKSLESIIYIVWIINSNHSFKCKALLRCWLLSTKKWVLGKALTNLYLRGMVQGLTLLLVYRNQHRTKMIKLSKLLLVLLDGLRSISHTYTRQHNAYYT